MKAGGIPPLRPQSVYVAFDRPFAFVAQARSSGLILVAGWIADVDDFHFLPEELVSLPKR